jgi:hypothetical protein
MNTQDKTLLQFLMEFDLGKVQVTPSDVLQSFGHSEESAAHVEIIFFNLKKNFEDGELPSLAASYLMRSGIEKVTIVRQKFSGKPPQGFEENSGFEKGSLIIGEDPDQGTITIQVSYSRNICSFIKQTT